MTIYLLKVLLGDNTGTSVEVELHLADLLVNVFHELDNKVDELVLVHLLNVEVGDEEADVIVLSKEARGERVRLRKSSPPYLDGLAAKDDKVLSTLHEEAGELLAEDLFNLVGLE